MNLRGLIHLFVVYIVWGSTYLAIRVAVREGAGFPPFGMVTMRLLLGSAILFGWARLSGRRLAITRGELLILIPVGILLWLGGNGLVTVAEQRAHSGYAALLVGAMPIWVALMEAMIDRRWPSWRLIVALLIGLAGVGVLNGPVIREGELGDVLAAAALISAGVLWGLGSIIQRRNPTTVDPVVNSGYLQLIGSGAVLFMALVTREPLPAPTPPAWFAWGYLVVFGSVLAFTSFVKALRLLPTSLVMTYAYVNPVVAVFLGWLILSEPFTLWTFAGSVLVILGVAGVFHERRRELAKES